MPECKTSVPGWSPDYEFDPLVEGPVGAIKSDYRLSAAKDYNFHIPVTKSNSLPMHLVVIKMSNGTFKVFNLMTGKEHNLSKDSLQI